MGLLTHGAKGNPIDILEHSIGGRGDPFDCCLRLTGRQNCVLIRSRTPLSSLLNVFGTRGSCEGGEVAPVGGILLCGHIH